MINPISTWHLLQNDQEQAAHDVSSLIKTNKTTQSSENYWFPTPKNPGNPDEQNPIQKRVLREIQALQDSETLDPTANAESRSKLLANFNWKFSILTASEIESIDDLLVEFHDFNARHRLDKEMTDDFNVKINAKG